MVSSCGFHRVTVLMSVYNSEKYLLEAIRSILNQTFSDFEFLIINDGSSDRSLEIIESLRDPRVRIINNSCNIGLTKSLNIGIKQACGELIARMDADDISYPDRLRCQVDFLDSHPEVMLVGSSIEMLDEKGVSFQIWHTPTDHSAIVATLKEGNAFGHGSVMFRKACVENVGLYREKFRYSQDFDYWQRFAERYETANIKDVLYKLRRSSTSISRSKLGKQLDFHLLAIAFARQRSQKGSDDYGILIDDNVENFLAQRCGLTKAFIRKFKSDKFIINAQESLAGKDKATAFTLLLRGFLLAPSFRALKKCLQITRNILLS